MSSWSTALVRQLSKVTHVMTESTDSARSDDDIGSTNSKQLPEDNSDLQTAISDLGIAFGVTMFALPYAAIHGMRDFTSTMQLVAGHYDLVCTPATADNARSLLTCE